MLFSIMSTSSVTFVNERKPHPRVPQKKPTTPAAADEKMLAQVAIGQDRVARGNSIARCLSLGTLFMKAKLKDGRVECKTGGMVTHI